MENYFLNLKLKNNIKKSLFFEIHDENSFLYYIYCIMYIIYIIFYIVNNNNKKKNFFLAFKSSKRNKGVAGRTNKTEF